MFDKVDKPIKHARYRLPIIFAVDKISAQEITAKIVLK